MHYKKIFKQWINSDFLTVSEKLKIQEYTEKEKEILFSDKNFSFGTAGIRRKTGIAPQLLNKHTYKLLAIGYAKYLKKVSKFPSVLIAHDNREKSDEYAWEVASTLKNLGIKVFLPHSNIYMSTPILSYYIRKMNLTGGINITASHNPPDYNGFKTYNSSGCQTNLKEEKIILKNIPEIKEIFNIQFLPCCNFEYLPENFVDIYFSDLIKEIPKTSWKSKKMKILFSSHHGTSSNNMVKLANKLGFENFIEFPDECNIDSKINKGEITNPEEPKSFDASIKYAESENFKYICAHDPDSDRAAVAEKQEDKSWYFFNGNEMGILFFDFLIRNKKNIENSYIVNTYVTGDLIEKIVPENIPIIKTKTGFKNISEKIEKYQKNKKNLLIAYEEAIGALFFPINREKDAYQQTAITLEIIAECLDKKTKLTDLLKEIYKKTGPWLGITDFYLIKHENWREILDQILEKLKNHEKSKIFDFQIKKIEFNDLSDAVEWEMECKSWIKFRISGTENKLKIYYNLYGNDLKNIHRNLKMFRKYFQEYLNL